MKNWIPDFRIRTVWVLEDFTDREFETRVREIKISEQKRLEREPAYARTEGQKSNVTC